MRSVKKIMVMLAAGLLCFTAGVAAQGPIEKIEAYLRADYKMVIDGEPAQLSLPPLIYQDRTFLPLYEIGTFLDADIAFDSAAKTIYVNRRISDLQPSVGEQENYESIDMIYATGMLGQYLGRDYPVLTISTMGGTTYYRAKDLERMGIDIQPLKKARDSVTEAIFISEHEASQAWKTTPVWKYPYPQPVIVTGEDHQDKIDALAAFQPVEYLLPEDGQGDLQVIPLRGHAIVIDRVSEDSDDYEMLYYNNGDYWLYELSLRSREKQIFEGGGKIRYETEWYVGSYRNFKLTDDR